MFFLSLSGSIPHHPPVVLFHLTNTWHTTYRTSILYTSGTHKLLFNELWVKLNYALQERY